MISLPPSLLFLFKKFFKMTFANANIHVFSDQFIHYVNTLCILFSCNIVGILLKSIQGREQKGDDAMRAVRAKKILTIDDDEDIRSSISDRLEMEGFQTVWAKNGRVALDYLNATIDIELPDLILLDFMMPIMNGQEFCREKSKIKRLSHIPVVMMTAGGNLVNVMDKIDQNAEAYMSKPLDDYTIISLVQQILEGMPQGPSELAHGIDSVS